MKSGHAKGRTVDEHISAHMKDPRFKKAWRDLDLEFELLESMIKARGKAGITQARLARMIGSKQSAISRLERGAFGKATVETLKKIADALDSRLVIRLQKKSA